MLRCPGRALRPHRDTNPSRQDEHPSALRGTSLCAQPWALLWGTRTGRWVVRQGQRAEATALLQPITAIGRWVVGKSRRSFRQGRSSHGRL